MEIVGNKIKLIPARQIDREKIYSWLCQSDLTSSIMGPPKYPDHPIPTLENFCNEYPLSFFNASGDGKGRVFIITANGEEVGTVGYDLLDKEKDRAVLDIWMKAEQYCGHGYGSDALNTLSSYIHNNYGISNLLISPSERNKRAVAAYKKAGFEYVKTMAKKEQEKEFGLSEYNDNLLMIKRLITKQSS
ncbi:MAG: GNAT family N-acetyltransferase [Nitrospirota bacterium]